MLDLGRVVFWHKFRHSVISGTIGIFFAALFSTDSTLIATLIGLALLCWLTAIARVNVSFHEDCITYRNGLRAHRVNYFDIQQAEVEDNNYLISLREKSVGLKLKSGKVVQLLGIPSLTFNTEKYIGPTIEWINWRISDQYDPKINISLKEISESKRLPRKMSWIIAFELIIGFTFVITVNSKFGRGSGAGGGLLASLVGGIIHDHAETVRDKNIDESKTFSEIIKSRSA